MIINGTVQAEEETRFKFGQNWNRFITHINTDRIHSARESLSEMLEQDNLENKQFLDVGSGSGLFSLAAHQLGAEVYSFDYDRASVESTMKLREKFSDDLSSWHVEQGSILDEKYVNTLGEYDVVYAWGVLHHTGNMSKALENTISKVKKNGKLFIAIYNYQPFKTSYWKVVKKAYNKNVFYKTAIILIHMPYFYVLRGIVRVLTGRVALARGMSLWHDMLDWLGGYPFEAAKPEQVTDFYIHRGFTLQKLRTCGGRSGCNEFVFLRVKNTQI